MPDFPRMRAAILCVLIPLIVRTIPIAGPPPPLQEEPLLPVAASLWELSRAYLADREEAVQAVADQHGLALAGNRVLAVIEYSSQTRALVEQLVALGCEIGTVASDRLSALVPVRNLPEVGALTQVRAIRPPLPMATMGTISEGLAPLGVSPWHQAGYLGQGVTAAVIDLGFADWMGLQASGDLPPGDRLVQRNLKFESLEENGQHGSAVAEVLYDMAPGIDRLILYALDEDPDLEAVVDDMLAEGVQVAAMSLGWANASPYDGTGFLCDQVNRARQGGIFWAIAAGNQAHLHYEGLYSPYGSGSFHAFGGETDVNQLGIFVAGSQLTIALSWNEWPTATSDYDLAIARFNFSDWEIEHVFQDNLPTPTEGGHYVVQNTGIYGAMIQKVSGEDRHLELYYLGGDILGLGLDYQVPGSSLMSPADADGAVAVGAFGYGTPDEIEYFSSQGPRNGPGGVPWEGTCPNPNCKPDLAGPDGNRTVSYRSLPFYGTSSAAPHIAGAAALVWSANPSFSVDEVITFLEGRALDQGDSGDDNIWGMGRVQLGPPPGTTPPSPSVTPTATGAAGTPSATSSPSATATAPANDPTQTLAPTVTASPPSGNTPTSSLPAQAHVPLLLKQALARRVVLRLDPPGSVNASRCQPIQITADAGPQPVDTVRIVLHLEGDLWIGDRNGEAVSAILPGQAFSEIIWNHVDGEGGEVLFVARQPEPPWPQDTFTIASLRVCSPVDKGGTIVFGQASDALYDSKSVLRGTEGGAYFDRRGR